MKNLFSVNRTLDRENNDYDPSPYLAATVSEELQEKLRGAFSSMEEKTATREPTEEELALKKKGNFYWKLCLLFFLGGLLLFIFGDSIPGYREIPAFHLIDIACMVVAVVFNFKARKLNRSELSIARGSMDVDFSEATKQLEEAAAEAARELGVPENALSVDILPFHYKMKGDTPVPAGKKNRYDNLSVSLYVSDGDLCLATAHELFRVPLAHVKGYRTYDEEFEIDMWLKPEESDTEKYAEFGIRKSGFFSRKLRGYYGLDLGGEYEVRIPCYDFAEVKGLLGVACLDDVPTP